MKLCKDCKFCEEDMFGGYEFATCNATLNLKMNPLNGTIRRKWDLASTQRYGSWFDAYLEQTCGPQGRWFQKKLEVET